MVSAGHCKQPKTNMLEARRDVISPLPLQGRRYLEFWSGDVKPSVGSLVRLSFFEKTLPAACSVVEAEMREWLVVCQAEGSARQWDITLRKPPKGNDTHSHTLPI